MQEEVRKDADSPDEISLIDIVMPLVRHWKAMAAVALCGFVILAAVFLVKPRPLTVTVDFSTAPVTYQNYQAAVNLLGDSDNQKLFFTKDRLGVDPDSYFVGRESHDSTVGLKYFDISYPAPYLAKDNIDLFRGYFDSSRRLNQSPQGDFSISFSSNNRDKNLAKSIAASLVGDYLPACWDKALFRELVESKKQSSRVMTTDIAALQIERNRLVGTIALLEQFQREFPSLIRTNLTLTDNMMPVEVQLMNARQRMKTIDDSMKDYTLSLVRFAAWQKFTTSIDALDIATIDKKGFQLYCQKCNEICEDSFAVDPTFIQSGAASDVEVKAILDSEKTYLSDLSRQMLLSVDHDIKVDRIEVLADKRSMKTLVVAAVGIVFLAILSAYLVQAVSSIKKKISEE
mgnify:CR=1 FL=1